MVHRDAIIGKRKDIGIVGWSPDLYPSAMDIAWAD